MRRLRLHFTLIVLLALIAMVATGCLRPSRARIDFSNVSKEDIEKIVIGEQDRVFSTVGPIPRGSKIHWEKKIHADGFLSIGIYFQSGRRITHQERYFSNQRQVTMHIGDNSVNVDVIYEGFL